MLRSSPRVYLLPDLASAKVTVGCKPVLLTGRVLPRSADTSLYSTDNNNLGASLRTAPGAPATSFSWNLVATSWPDTRRVAMLSK